MLGNLVDKLSNKKKLVMSFLGLVGTILGAPIVTLLLCNFWSLIVILVSMGLLNLFMDIYDNSKKAYCFEMSTKYFEQNKDNVNIDKELGNIRMLSKINKLGFNALFGTFPFLFLLFMILVSFGVSFSGAASVCGGICLTSFSTALFSMECSGFYIDVLCEIVDKVENYRSEQSSGYQRIKANENNICIGGISQHRHKYVPGAFEKVECSRADISPLFTDLRGYSDVLKRTRRPKR